VKNPINLTPWILTESITQIKPFGISTKQF
jgi:hypothetical protein